LNNGHGGLSCLEQLGGGSNVAKLWPGGRVTPRALRRAVSVAAGLAELAIRVVSGVTTVDPAWAVIVPTLLPVRRSVPPIEISFQEALTGVGREMLPWESEKAMNSPASSMSPSLFLSKPTLAPAT
jgi:hypothetical protein